MSQATTRQFRWCFPEWVNASKVTVTCEKEKDTISIQIAQYCDPDQSCRTMNKPGVLLEMDGVRLTITNCSYDSWSCKAVSYINDIEQGPETFTVDVCNRK